MSGFSLSDFMASVPMSPIDDPTKPKKPSGAAPPQQPTAQTAPPIDPVAHYLNTYVKPKPASAESTATADPVQSYLDKYKPPQAGVFARAFDSIANAVTHPLDTAKGMYEGAKQDFETAGGYLGQRAAELTLPSDVRALAEADPTRISGKNAALAGARIASLAAAPAVGGAITRGVSAILPNALARTVSAVATGAGVGAVNDLNDPLAGAVAGATLGGVGDVAARGIASTVKGIGSIAVDRAGRPMETTQIKIAGIPIGSIEGLRDKATRLNVAELQSKPTDGMSPFTEKPAAIADVFGTSGVRAARGMKVASPVAESIAKGALQGRADDAVSRVIEHALETTGLVNRESGIRLTNDLINARSEEANAAFPALFEKYQGAITDPRIAREFGTDAGQRAWRDVPRLMRNRYLTPPDAMPASFDPSTLSPEKAALYQRLVQMNGGDVSAANQAMEALGEVPNAPASDVPPMNLQQLHYWAKALDLMADAGDKRGPGSVGNAYGDAKAIQAIARNVRQIAKDNVGEYGDLTQRYAEDSDLIRGSELGKKLFRFHPDEIAIELERLPSAAQDVFRRAGFDALAQRVEEGPANVERTLGKSLDKRRMAFLFPDAQSFEAFKQGLGEEGQLHANGQTILGGSPTADKLADLADIAGVTLPDVMRAAATGRWHRLMGQAVANVTRKVLGSGADRLTAERMNQLMTGANGDVAARNEMLARYGVISPQQPPRPARAWAGAQPVQYNPDLLQAGSIGGPTQLGGPMPSTPRLPFTTPVAGDVQQGTAIPLRMVPERRLPSAGPSPVATANSSPVGPAIPQPGQSFDALVQQEVMKLYRNNPEWAVTLTRDQQAKLEQDVRRVLMNPNADGRMSFMDVARLLMNRGP